MIWNTSSTCFKSILILFLILCVIGTYSQELDGYRLVGSRKYSYNSKGERIEKRSYDVNRKLVSFVHYKFDTYGNKIETLKYNCDSTLQKRYIYFYNLDNQKVKSIKCDYKKAKESSKVFTNNCKSEIIRTDYFNENGFQRCMEVVYSDKGEIESRKYFDKDGEITSENKFRYDYQNGRIVKKYKYSGSDQLLTATTYLYDDEGNKISYSSYYVSGSKSNKKRLYQYNSIGQCIASSVYESVKTK